MLRNYYLRKSVRTQILNALTNANIQGFEVCYGIEKKNASKFVVYTLDRVRTSDNLHQYELELNIVGAMSEFDKVENCGDCLQSALDYLVTHDSGFSYYVYANTRNQMQGSDPHTTRERLTFDLNLYEGV